MFLDLVNLIFGIDIINLLFWFFLLIIDNFLFINLIKCNEIVKLSFVLLNLELCCFCICLKLLKMSFCWLLGMFLFVFLICILILIWLLLLCVLKLKNIFILFCEVNLIVLLIKFVSIWWSLLLFSSIGVVRLGWVVICNLRFFWVFNCKNIMLSLWYMVGILIWLILSCILLVFIFDKLRILFNMLSNELFDIEIVFR